MHHYSFEGQNLPSMSCLGNPASIKSKSKVTCVFLSIIHVKNSYDTLHGQLVALLCSFPPRELRVAA